MSLGEKILLRFSRDPGAEDLEEARNPWTLENALDPLKRKYPQFPAMIEGRKVLDFGSGAGWQSVAMAAEGAGRVVGVDINPRNVEQGRDLAARLGPSADRVSFVRTLPEEELGTFDVVLSQNSMEHFEDPAAILTTMTGAVRPGGRVLITFGPPWFAPYGSHMHFFTRVPWVNLLFPESTVMRVRSRFRSDGATRYEDVESGLNRMSIRRFEWLIERAGLRPELLRYDCVKGLDFLGRIPLLRELFINDVTCSLVRPGRNVR